jgi:hypothetical protein
MVSAVMVSAVMVSAALRLLGLSLATPSSHSRGSRLRESMHSLPACPTSSGRSFCPTRCCIAQKHCISKSLKSVSSVDIRRWFASTLQPQSSTLSELYVTVDFSSLDTISTVAEGDVLCACSALR